MKKFIKKTIFFLIVPLVVGIPLFLLVDARAKSNFAQHKFAREFTIAFVGDSHIQCAVNDSLIPFGKNFAEASESFYFSYFKLKSLLEATSSFKHIYIGISYHSFSKYYDRFVCGDWSLATAPKYFNFLSFNEQLKMMYWNRSNLLSFTNTALKKGLQNESRSDDDLFGEGYVNNFYNMQAVDTAIEKRIKFQYYTDDMLNDISVMNLEYLDKIIALCKEKNIELSFVNTPLHKKYYVKVPERFKVKLEELVKARKIHFIDLGSLDIGEDGFTPDGDHVTHKGSILTTNELVKILKY